MNLREGKLDFLGHDGFLITLPNGRIIAIDPYNVSQNLPKADIILITHSHYDHCSIKDISSLSKEGTILVIPPDAQSKITRVEGIKMQIVEVGDEINLGNVRIEALPAYNVNKDFHSKSEGWLGYLVKFGNEVIYHAGDCDKIPEMKKLTGYGKEGNEFVALLPVSGKYVMDAEEASQAASLINAHINIPMHYGAGVVGTREDAEKFVKLCDALGLHARIIEKI